MRIATNNKFLRQSVLKVQRLGRMDGKILASVAQLEERLRPKEMVGGSIPPGGIL